MKGWSSGHPFYYKEDVVPQYKSKFKDFRVNIRPEVKKYHPEMPVVMDTIPAMVAEFGVHDGEYTYIDPETGLSSTHVNIRGHFYDLDVDAERKGWTGEEKAIAQKRLDELCQTWPEAIQKIEAAAPVAPWATYDNINFSKIPALAIELGLVSEALVYEKATKARKSVIAELEKALATSAVEEELVAQ